MKQLYRSDLHVHSNYSNKSSIWAMRKLNCPESFTSPRFIYNTARKMGMDYVTITDHNTIDGALEIAHMPGVFISAEVTTYFPENGCKLHVIVLDVSESSFRELMTLGKNVYELIAYLQKEGIVHFVSHPLYDMNEKLTVDVIEKMLLIFDVFEVKNGARAEQFNSLISNVIHSLTPESYERLPVRHDISPCRVTSWHKATVGGSDDHSGFFIARAYTVTRKGRTLDDFLASIRSKRVWAEGDNGDPLTLAHSIYGIGYRFYSERLKSGTRNATPFIDYLLSRLFDENSGKVSLLDKIKFFVRKNIPEMYDSYDDRSFEEILDREAKRLVNDMSFLKSINSEDRNRRIFRITSYLANRMIYIYTNQLLKIPSSNGIFRILQLLNSIGMVHLLISPYYVAFFHQHRSKRLMSRLKGRFGLNGSGGCEKTILFTDTINEINGVAITIKKLIETSKTRGVELTVVTCNNQETGAGDGIMNFKSVGEFAIPEYPELRLHFPPILDVVDYLEREGFTRIHASTPGILGLLALLISKLMDIPISATYHTDIPQYVKSLTDDVFLENTAWNYIIWFYSQMDEVLVPSKSTEKQLIEKGLSPEKIRPLPRWVDTGVFSPVKRNEGMWQSHGLNGEMKFLYVGRISREKNLELLADAFIETISRGFCVDLVVVGDGPYRAELEKRLSGYPVLFTGFLEGEALSAIYASSDVFVFPSTTDTFGNVVLEAQASGLPVIVSDKGGPRELMVDNETGVVISADNKTLLADALELFLTNREKAGIMGENARRFVENKAIHPRDMYSTILRDSLAGAVVE
ncbi:MAG TPA: glycosyltransferase [Nitrospirae bacterium]|nr:glycosyltransferase [Nitrospirota bacterium]